MMNIQKDDLKHIIVLIIAFFLIHGQMAYNTLAWHDEVVSIFGGWAGGLEHGRFTQRWIADIFSYVAGIDGAPVFHSLIGSICIAIIIVLLYKIGGGGTTKRTDNSYYLYSNSCCHWKYGVYEHFWI